MYLNYCWKSLILTWAAQRRSEWDTKSERVRQPRDVQQRHTTDPIAVLRSCEQLVYTQTSHPIEIDLVVSKERNIIRQIYSEQKPRETFFQTCTHIPSAWDSFVYVSSCSWDDDTDEAAEEVVTVKLVSLNHTMMSFTLFLLFSTWETLSGSVLTEDAASLTLLSSLTYGSKTDDWRLSDRKEKRGDCVCSERHTKQTHERETRQPLTIAAYFIGKS